MKHGKCPKCGNPDLQKMQPVYVHHHGGRSVTMTDKTACLCCQEIFEFDQALWEQTVGPNEVARTYFAVTGVPLVVGSVQYRAFIVAGVDPKYIKENKPLTVTSDG